MIKNAIDTMLFEKYVVNASDEDVENFSSEEMRAEIISILKKQCGEICRTSREAWTKEVIEAKLRAVEQLLEYFDIRYNGAAPGKPRDFHVKAEEPSMYAPKVIMYDMAEFEAYVLEKIDAVFSADRSNTELVLISRALSAMLEVLQESNFYGFVHQYEVEQNDNAYADLRSFTISDYEPQLELGL